ncbi:MAG: 1-acyl-sn-glycerol-3-phosphate acyltransferase [Deltaproteobacteria bacterium]|nr:1-acyl-sn-glycerol-3-phosphate acyltransferase [Deltaproteobacteria bacterium]
MQKGVVPFVIGIGLFGIGTALSTAAYVLTFGRSMDFSRRFIMRPLVNLALRVYGIRVEIDGYIWHRGPAFYLFNHHSNLDIFVIAALNLPHLRSFFSTERPKHAPMMWAARSIGAFLVPPQYRHEARVGCFRHAERELMRTAESVIASPEGSRFTGGGVAPFNKGVFHLAVRLKYPVVPLLFEIPPEANAGASYFFRPSTVRIRALDPIETQGLSELDVARVRDRAYQMYQVAMASRGIQNRNSTSTTVAERNIRSPDPCDPCDPCKPTGPTGPTDLRLIAQR